MDNEERILFQMYKIRRYDTAVDNPDCSDTDSTPIDSTTNPDLPS